MLRTVLKIFYKDEWVTVVNADYRSVLGEIGPYDHVITDPPYDDETHDGAQFETRPTYSVDFAHLPDVPTLVDSLIPRRWALSFCSVEMLGAYRAAAGARWIRSGIWDRLDGAPQMSGDRPAQPAEGIAIWHARARIGRTRWNGGGKRAIWRCGVVRGDDRVHQTQKPERLIRELVLDFTDPGDIIFDPFAGSGTTGVAAKRCGRRAIVVELEERHCVSAATRLAATEPDPRLVRVAVARGHQGALAW